MQQLTASPHIRSDRADPHPHSACMRRGSHEDETHLQGGWSVGPRVARSSSIPRCPRRESRRGRVGVEGYAVAGLSLAPVGTSPVVTKRHSATISLRAKATMAMRLIRLLALTAR